MSLLMFRLSDEQVVILTDTLATSPSGEPLLLVTKCGVVPHLGMVIAGTGTASLADRWRAQVHSSLLCRDIDMLDLHTPAALRVLWREVTVGLDDAGLAGVTATVYQFGLSESAGRYVGYAYRSSDGFASERLQSSAFAIKPHPAGAFDAPKSSEAMVELAIRVREEQDALPADERIYIGGELVLMVLEAGAISSAKVHRFEDFEDVWQHMNDVLDT